MVQVAQEPSDSDIEDVPVEDAGEEMVAVDSKAAAANLSPVDDVEALPMSILSRTEYFDQLFELLEREDKYAISRVQLSFGGIRGLV
jgi:hypothetical protein